MNTSYLYRLRDEISETQKIADTRIKEKKIVLSAPLPAAWAGRAGKYIQEVFKDEAWEATGCSPPDLTYVAGTTAHYYFGSPRTGSLNVLLSAASSILTRIGLRLSSHPPAGRARPANQKPSREGAKPKYTCVCTVAQMTNLPEIFAFFVLEGEAHYREVLSKKVGEPLDHLTEDELKTKAGKYAEGITKGRVHRPNKPGLDMCLSFVEYERQVLVLFGEQATI